MTTKTKKTTNELVLTGNPAEDFSSWLKSKDKPFDIGIQLIRKYTDNKVLPAFLEKEKDNPKAPKILLNNIKIISKKWLKK